MKWLLQDRRERWGMLALLVVMGTVVALLTSFNPLRYDDIMYQYMCMDMGPEAIHYNHAQRIEGFMDVLASMKNWYFLENGRLLVHFVAQCFCGFLGKPLFNVLNGVVYALFLYGCLRWLRVCSFLESLLVVGLLWLALPVQYIFTVSVAYALNYLWVATAVTLGAHFARITTSLGQITPTSLRTMQSSCLQKSLPAWRVCTKIKATSELPLLIMSP